MKKLRIAYGRIAQETNAFSPVPSTLADFERLHLLGASELGPACGRLGREVKGMVRNAELSGFCRAARKAGGVQTVPLFSAWALPSGPVDDVTVEALKARLVCELRAAGDLDGVFLCLHGAMRGGPSHPEPEEELLAAVREVVGPVLPVAASFDLHGQMTPGKVEPLTVMAAYRTNPHRDLARTGFRAGDMLIRTARGEVKPTWAWRALPTVVGGGWTIDFLAPMRRVFGAMKRMERRRRVLDVSLFTCHLWNDSPDLGWSVHVITDDDPALAEQLADELADLAWRVRDIPPPRVPEPREAIAAARDAWLARRTGTVCMIDASDVVGAGSVGENTHLLKAFIEDGGGLLSYVPLRDAEAVAQLWDTAPGAEVTLAVGGRLDPVTFPPLEVMGRVQSRARTDYFGRAVVLAIGDVRLVLTELAPYTVKPRFYKDVGLDPWRADVVVVKAFFHFRIYYAAVNRKTLGAKTHGFTDLDAYRRVSFRHPTFPIDALDDWRDGDRRRRGLDSASRSTAAAAG